MWRFERVSREKVADAGLAEKLHAATTLSLDKMAEQVADMPHWQALRDRARQVKLHTLTHLDRYLRQFIAAAESNGAVVSWAETGEAACRQVVEVARRHGVTRAVKGKSMTGEEIELNRALEQAGIEPVETDFGEMICQLAGELPSHVTAPIIQWSIEEVARLLKERGIIGGISGELLDADAGVALLSGGSIRGVGPIEGTPRPRPGAHGASHLGAHGASRFEAHGASGLGDRSGRVAVAARLVAAARRTLRERFMTAGMGITGANFAVARSGTLVLVENEANIRLSTTLPKVHVAVVGIDKLIPTLADLGTFLSLLPVAATGQRQSAYVSLIHRPFEHLHIILLDNGRTKLLADKQHYDLLSCIRCGACMNVCPVYRHVSGHGYNAVYPGPIGAVLMPHLRPEAGFRQLPFASSLCGACSEICPVGIPLAERLLEWRERIVREGGRPWAEAGAFRAWAWLMRHPGVYRAARPRPDWIEAVAGLIGPGRRWRATRDLPVCADETFGDWWKKNRAITED